MLLSTVNDAGMPLLSLLVFAPAVGAASLMIMPRRHAALHHAVGIFTSGVALALAAVILYGYDRAWRYRSGGSAFQFSDPPAGPAAWLPGGITFHVAVDGISVVLVALTALLVFLALAFSFGSITTRVREYVALMLVLETGALGVFVALDLFLFFVFWEATLVPMFLLIGIWGGGGRVYASFKFALYTLVGSALMLVAIVALIAFSGSRSFHFFDVLEAVPAAGFGPGLAMAFFLAFALAFAVKVPLFPLHTWLPFAHVEAPTAGSVVLAGILLKMGTYGFVRFAIPLFPDAARAAVPWAMGLAIAGIVYGGLVAFAQADIKRLVAYSSVSHLGIVMVGVFALNAEGWSGGVLQMVNHGLSTGALFLLVGMLYDRAHTRRIEDFGGLWAHMPRFATIFLLVTFASVGLPGTNGFVGEWLALLGAFQAAPIYGALAALGIVLGAAYMLWMFQRVFFGPASELSSSMPDLDARELAVLVPIVALILWIGVAPGFLLEPIEVTAGAWIDWVAGAAEFAGAP